MIEQTRFLSTVFLCSEFKLENIYSGVNFCGKNVCGNFYLRELIFADRWKNRKNRKKIRAAKNLCHTVRALGSLGDFRIKRGVCHQCKMRTGCVRMGMRMADVKMRMEKKNTVKSSKPEACQTCGISIKITVIITII